MDFPKLIRLNMVLKLTTLSTSTIYRLMKKGQFPRQIKISERSTRWDLGEIFEWMDGNFKSREESYEKSNSTNKEKLYGEDKA